MYVFLYSFFFLPILMPMWVWMLWCDDVKAKRRILILLWTLINAGYNCTILLRILPNFAQDSLHHHDKLTCKLWVWLWFERYIWNANGKYGTRRKQSFLLSFELDSRIRWRISHIIIDLVSNVLSIPKNKMLINLNAIFHNICRLFKMVMLYLKWI